jgi:alkyl hydroperoxide reductase subunit D
MVSLSELKSSLGDDTKDLRLNLDAVLRGSVIDLPTSYAIALCSAIFIKDDDLAQALLAEAVEQLSPEAVSDARAAAAIMGMNTVYYRFRHMIEKPSYGAKPAGLRMNRMVRPATNKTLFELCSMACAALAGCQMCIQSHEASLLKEGQTEDQVHEAVRIASVVNGFSTAVFAAPVGQGL